MLRTLSVEHTTRLAAAPGVLSLATSTPEGSDVGSIPTCGIQIKSTPMFVNTGLLGLPEKVTMEDESTGRHALASCKIPFCSRHALLTSP